MIEWSTVAALLGAVAALVQILQWAESSRWLRRIRVINIPHLGLVFNLCLLILLGIILWRLNTLESGVKTTDLRFAQWFVTPDATSCAGTIDATRLSRRIRSKYEIALACGFVDPSTDAFKDDRITVSPLFTPQDAVLVVVPMRTIMADALEKDRQDAVKRSGAPKGMQLTLGNTIWFKALLLPKGTDVSSIHRLSDVPLHGGELGDGAAVGIVRTVTVE